MKGCGKDGRLMCPFDGQVYVVIYVKRRKPFERSIKIKYRILFSSFKQTPLMLSFTLFILDN